MLKNLSLLFGAALIVILQACNSRHEVQVAPVEIKPIHITIDVNVRVERALEDFFGDIDRAEEKIEVPPAVE
ncbi:MAG TPA: hypothetical protein PKV75_04705 [Desulfobacterales bacterium]|nr:hypothetical protein [Desulfobacterales bacterium]